MSIQLNRVEQNYLIGHQDGYTVQPYDPTLRHDEAYLAGYQRGSITHAEEEVHRRLAEEQAKIDRAERLARLNKKRRVLAAIWLMVCAIVFVVSKSLGMMLITAGVGAIHVWGTMLKAKHS